MRSCQTRRRSGSQRYSRQVASPGCVRLLPTYTFSPSCAFFVNLINFECKNASQSSAVRQLTPVRSLKSQLSRSTNPRSTARRALPVAHASPPARARARSVSPRAHARPLRECHSALPPLRHRNPIISVRQRWVFCAGFYGCSAALMRVCVAGIAHLCPALRVARRCALTLASAPAQVPRPCGSQGGPGPGARQAAVRCAADPPSSSHAGTPHPAPPLHPHPPHPRRTLPFPRGGVGVSCCG